MSLSGSGFRRGGALLSRARLALAALALVALAGCATVSEPPATTRAAHVAGAKQNAPLAAQPDPTEMIKGKVSDDTFRVFKGEYEIAPSMAKTPPGTIAVLPFGGEPSQWRFTPKGMAPTEIVRRGLYSHLAGLSFRDIKLYEVDQQLSTAGLMNVTVLRETLKKDPQRLKRLLNADAALIGEVTHFDRLYFGLVSQVAVGCTLEMYDLTDGRVLWRAAHVSRGMGGGVALDVVGLAVGALSSIWNLRDTELLNQTDDLFREIVSTIEKHLPFGFKGTQTVQPPPRIDLFACLNAEKPFGPGQTMAFRLVGDPGGQATVELVGYKTGIALRPLAPQMKEALWAQLKQQIARQRSDTGRGAGADVAAALDKELRALEIYEGEYAVLPGEEARNLLAKATLVRGTARGEAYYTTQLITIDSKAKDAPASFLAEPLDNKVKLVWAKAASMDVATYEVLMSASATTGYAVAAQIEATTATIENLRNFEPVYFKLRAVSRSGNTSAESEPLLTRPLPEPGLDALPKPGPALSGEIRGKVLLAAEKGPFTVQSDLIVPAGSALYIEPGATLAFAPAAALRVQGGDLLVYGRSDKPVRFAPAAANAGAGAFEGLILDRAGRSLLHGLVIEKATTGLRVRQCGPDVAETVISQSAQAGVALEDGARPNIRCSRIVNNQGMGGLVVEGQAVSPQIRHNSFEDNAPFQVQSFTPIGLDLSSNYWGSSGPLPEAFLGQIRLDPILASPPSGPCRGGGR